jgi:hypothetical protein
MGVLVMVGVCVRVGVGVIEGVMVAVAVVVMLGSGVAVPVVVERTTEWVTDGRADGVAWQAVIRKQDKMNIPIRLSLLVMFSTIRFNSMDI